MTETLHLTGFDFVVIALLLLLTVRGLWVGFLRQVTTLVALLAAYGIAGQYHDKLFPFLRGITDNPHTVFWVSYAILFALSYVVTMLLGKGLAKVVELTIAGWFDKLLGGVLGVFKAVIFIVLLNMLLSGVLAPENTMLRNSQSSPYVNQVTDVFRSYIKDDRLRQAFARKKPAISEETVTPQQLPADGVRPFVPTPNPPK
jgi:membrane protein required for colicin V production